MFLLQCTFCFNNMVTFPSSPVSTNFLTYSYKVLILTYPNFLTNVVITQTHTLSYLLIYSSFLINGHANRCVLLFRQIPVLVCFCSVFLFVISLLNDILFIKPVLFCYYFTFSSVFRSPNDCQRNLFSLANSCLCF
jgi:hypothetical protein